MAKTAPAIVFPVVLKSILSDTHRDDSTFTRNDKQVRATLRAKLADDHMKNTSWIAHNQREYDRIRCAYDNAYVAKLEAAKKRKPRVAKTKAPVAEVVIETSEA